MKKIYLALMLSTSLNGFSQTSSLNVDMIMQDQKWIGVSPSDPYWSRDGYLLFNWNPENNTSDSLYYVSVKDLTPRKVNFAMQQQQASVTAGSYNSARTGHVYESAGDIFFADIRNNKMIRITQTVERESNPVFLTDNSIAFIRSQNVYAWDRASGTTRQLSNFQKGMGPKEDKPGAHEQWLKDNQLANSAVLRSRKAKQESAEAARKALLKNTEASPIYIDDKNISDIRISPGGRFITYRLSKPATNVKATIVPDYMAENGFTQNLPARAKVGAPEGNSEFFVFDTQKDTVLLVKNNKIPGLRDQADYEKVDSLKKDREITMYGASWNPSGTVAILDIRSADNKDRWLMLLDPATAKLSLLDRQRDEAWIQGPGITVPDQSAWINNHTVWFQGEESGYSHLYTMDINTLQKQQLTKGNFEVIKTILSANKKYFYITTNQEHPGEQHLYRLAVTGGLPEKLTSMKGAHESFVSPDEKYIAYRYSYTNKPWELYIQENKPNAKPVQVTTLARTAAFNAYNWRDPEVVTFKARDGENVYARLYRPATPHTSKSAVIFVHGAGYLQNAHRWWSSYSREYMFHNLLADLGYTVLDIDYRGSAGYGRNWRTGIYRHMGGKDLTDQVDGAKFLVDQYGVNAKKIGIYGGSYGGFITLMAMFTQPETFAAGAALRSVTDWGHYNHGYTSNILNQPFLDTTAYRKSSPIYYAEGLKGALLMCHGMVDTNVHFQDIVRLTQRLIELKKDNWELAVYPVEGHGFVEPSSWTDEYKRILKLFDRVLK